MSQVTFGVSPVSRKKPSPPEGDKAREKTIAVKIAVSVHQQARVIAAYHGVDLSDWLTDLVRDLVRREYVRIGGEMTEKTRRSTS